MSVLMVTESVDYADFGLKVAELVSWEKSKKVFWSAAPAKV